MLNSPLIIMESGDESKVLDLLIKRSFLDEENHPTSTSAQQVQVEETVLEAYKQYDKIRQLWVDPSFPELRRELTEEYLLQILTGFSPYEAHDCNRTWLCYWIIHALSLLNHELDGPHKSNVVKFLSLCQNESGGFGGGPGHFSHLAPTYAAVNTLVILGTEEAYNAINRETLLQFLKSLSVGDGSFYMHVGGEIDMRSVYCAISIAKLTNLYNDDLFRGSAEWIIRCQTYEGGFAGTPGMEAHGGYTFCGIAALFLINNLSMCDMKALLRWITNRQMNYEGGFQGRTNKLVDSCYSFWQAGAVAIINMNLLANENEKNYLTSDKWIFDSSLLQEYVLICCQHSKGGLIDKPLKRRDAYHTCYSLSGLSVSQNLPNGEQSSIGTDDNILEPVHPAYNISIKKLMDVKNHFTVLK